MKSNTIIVSLIGITAIMVGVVYLMWHFPETLKAPLSVAEQVTIIDAKPTSEPPPLLSVEGGAQTTLSSDPQWWLSISLSVMAIVTLISVATSFYLYRWRRILIKSNYLVVPEQLGVWVNDITKHMNGVIQIVDAGVKSVDHQSKEAKQGISELSETFMTLQSVLDEREAEIKRLKQGYDAHIFKNFVLRFIRVDQAVEDFQRAGGADQNGLEQIRQLLSDAFAECGVETFAPDIGEDYRHAHGVADNPKRLNADNPKDDFKIAEILESGYLIRSSGNADVIVPARVKIFAYQQGGVS